MLLDVKKKLQDWSLTIRWVSVLSGHLLGVVFLLCRDAIGVFFSLGRLGFIFLWYKCEKIWLRILTGLLVVMTCEVSCATKMRVGWISLLAAWPNCNWISQMDCWHRSPSNFSVDLCTVSNWLHYNIWRGFMLRNIFNKVSGYLSRDLIG